MRTELGIWRQDGPRTRGFLESHVVEDVKPQMSLLELSDRLNGQITEDGGGPAVFKSDRWEGVYGTYSFLASGVLHGLLDTIPICHQHLRTFPEVTCFRLGPWRSAALPVVRDLVAGRMTPDELIRTGETVDMVAGTVPDANDIAQGHLQAERTLDFAACIGCGACVAACLSGTAVLFVGTKLAHLSFMSQGRIERGRRARAMTREPDTFLGPCSGFGECLPACPARTLVEAITPFNREVLRAGLHGTTRDDQGLLHKQGHVREFVPQVTRSYP